MQVARHLVWVVAVEHDLQGVGIAAEVLPVNEFFELRLLVGKTAFQFARLQRQILERFLDFAALRRQGMQVSLCDGNFLFDAFELIGCAGAFALRFRDFLAQ